MPNVLIEFVGTDGVATVVECINTDNLKKTNDFPNEAFFAGHIEAAIERSDKHCYMTPEVFRTYLQGNFRNKVVLNIPYMVEDHIIVSVRF